MLVGEGETENLKYLQNLDNELKDIINVAATSSTLYFDFDVFMKHFTEKLTTRNSMVRQVLICWLDFLDQIPNVSLLIYLPNIIHELFYMLSDHNK